MERVEKWIKKGQRERRKGRTGKRGDASPFAFTSNNEIACMGCWGQKG